MQHENTPTRTVLGQALQEGTVRTASWWKRPVLGILPVALLTVSSAPQADVAETEPQQDEQSVLELGPIPQGRACPIVLIPSSQDGQTFPAISLNHLTPEPEEHPPYDPAVGFCWTVEFSEGRELYLLHKRDCADVTPKLMDGTAIDAYADQDEHRAFYALETLNVLHRCSKFAGYPAVRLQNVKIQP